MAVNTRKLVAALKQKRKAEGLSLRGLSSKIGISFSTLARIERGEGEPDNNSLVRILEWLGADARESGLSFENVALVHFRAGKNAQSRTIHCLLEAANILKMGYEFKTHNRAIKKRTSDATQLPESGALSLSKAELEEMAENFRRDLGVEHDAPFDALRLRIEGVDLFTPSTVPDLGKECLDHLQGAGNREWSAMSVPLDLEEDKWAILLNNRHTKERQRVTYLEECWHILLGHRPTRIAKVADAYGRTYDMSEEHDAFYLASATVLPKMAVERLVIDKIGAEDIGSQFGVSTELVEYRIKRLGLWRIYRGKQVSIS